MLPTSHGGGTHTNRPVSRRDCFEPPTWDSGGRLISKPTTGRACIDCQRTPQQDGTPGHLFRQGEHVAVEPRAMSDADRAVECWTEPQRGRRPPRMGYNPSDA